MKQSKNQLRRAKKKAQKAEVSFGLLPPPQEADVFLSRLPMPQLRILKKRRPKSLSLPLLPRMHRPPLRSQSPRS